MNALTRPSSCSLHRHRRVFLVWLTFPRFILPIVVLCLAIFACDLSAIFGGKPSSNSSAGTSNGTSGGGGSGSSSLITSFAFLQSNNQTALTKDEIATISAPNLYVTVPYNVIQNQTALTPTVTLQSGYTLTTPSGAFVPTDGMTLVITNLTNQSISNYTLHVSVDPGSIAFLQLAGPFYFDTTGTKQLLAAAQYTLALSPTGTYTLTLNTDSFQVPYNVNVVQNIITARPIGFTTANVPYGSFTTNLSAALAGTVVPYTVQVQSPSKSVTNTFTVQAARTKSNIVQLTDVSATIGYLYSYVYSCSYADSTLSNFLGSVYVYENGDNGQGVGTLGTGTFDSSTYDGIWAGATNNGTNSLAFQGTGGGWTGSYLGGTATASTVTSVVQINANNSAINGILTVPPSGVIASGSAIIDCGTSFTISSAITPGPALQPSTSQVNVPIYLQCSINDSANGGNSRQGYWSYSYSCTSYRSLNVPVNQTNTFTALSYPQFQTIVVKFPLYDTIVQVAPTTLVQSWSQSSNSTDYILTFNMVLQTTHVTGIVASLQLGAETGTVSSYTVAIN